MAKAKAVDVENRPNKSQAIRQVLADKPKAKPKEVAEIVNSQWGYNISPQYVSVVKSQAKKRKGRISRSGGKIRMTVPRRAAGSATSAEAIDAAIGLVEAAGGLDNARASLEQLERLRGKL